MRRRFHKSFRGSRHFEGACDPYLYNRFVNDRCPSKENTKSSEIIKSYMNPSGSRKISFTKMHTNIDIAEVLEDLRKQVSISGLNCLFSLLEDSTFGEQVLLYSFDIEEFLHLCIYSNTNEIILDQAFSCLTSHGIHFSLYKQDYFKSLMKYISESRSSRLFCRYIQALQTILESNCLSLRDTGQKIIATDKCDLIFDYIPLLLRELQYQLEIVDQVDQMQALVSCLLVFAENFPNQFHVYFIDWVDILLGWLVDIKHSLMIRSFISASLKVVQIQWSLEFDFGSQLLNNFCEDMENFSLELSTYDCRSKSRDFQQQSFIARLCAFSSVYDCVLAGNPNFEALSSESTSISLSILKILSFSLNLSTFFEISVNFISCFAIILSTTRICLPIYSTKFINFILLQFEIVTSESTAISLFNLLSTIIKMTTSLSTELSQRLIQCILGHSVTSFDQQNRLSVISISISTFYQSLFKTQNSLLIENLVYVVLGDLKENFILIKEFYDQQIANLPPAEFYTLDFTLDGTSNMNHANKSKIIYSSKLTSPNASSMQEYVDSTAILEKAKTSCFLFEILSFFAIHSTLDLLLVFHKIYQLLSSVLQSMSYHNCLKFPSFHGSAMHTLYEISLRFEHFLFPLLSSTATTHSRLIIKGFLDPPKSFSFPLEYITLCEIFSTFQYLLQNFVLNYDLINLLLQWFLEILESNSPALSNRNCNQALNTAAILLLILTYSKEQSIRLDTSKVFRKLIQQNLLSEETLRYCIPEFIMRLCDSLGEIRASYSGLCEIFPTHILVSYSLHNMPSFFASKNSIKSGITKNTPSYQLYLLIRHYFLSHSDKRLLNHEHFQALMTFVLQGHAATKQSSDVWLGNIFSSYYAQQSLQHSYFDKNIIKVITGNCDALLWYWIIYECANYCVSNKLQTFLGDPNSTFLTIESVLRKYISEVELRKECDDYFIESSFSSHGSSGTGLGPKHYTIYLRGVLLLQFIEQLEKLIDIAYYGSFTIAAKCTNIRTFYQKNIATCNEWFSRIRPAVMKMALYCGLPTMTMRCSLLIEGTLDVSYSSLFLLVEALISLKAPETLEGISISHQLVEKKWFKGAIAEAHGNYENASNFYRLSLIRDTTWKEDIIPNRLSLLTFSSDELDLFCSKRLVQCFFNLGHSEQLVRFFQPTKNSTISFDKSPFLLQNAELNTHLKQIITLSEFQEKTLQPSNSIFGKVISDYIHPHQLWTSKQQLHYSQILLIRGLVATTYNSCTNFSEDEFEWSPDESDLPPATLGPPRSDKNNISRWRRWLKQASAYAEAPLRVGALEWPIIILPYHILQLQAIAAVRAAHPDKFRLSQPVGSAFTSIGSSIIKLSPHQHDLAIWNHVLLVSRNLAEPEQDYASNMFLSVARLARKQGNISFAEKLLNTLIPTITNQHYGSCFTDSCKVLSKKLASTIHLSALEEKHLPIHYECSKLLFLKSEFLIACNIILKLYANYINIIDDLSQLSREKIYRMLLCLSKWFQADESLFEQVFNAKSEDTGMYSLLFIRNFHIHSFSWQDCITGLLQCVTDERYASNLGKVWLKFANWNFRMGARMHNAADYDQNAIFSFEEDKIMQLIPVPLSDEVKRNLLISISKLIVDNIRCESENSLIGKYSFDFDSCPNIYIIQKLSSNFPCLKEINFKQKISTIWFHIVERLFSPYKYSAQAYFTFLRKSSEDIKESDSLLASLRLLRLTGNFFTEMKHTLKYGFYYTPICVWKRILPQLVCMLNCPNSCVRQIILTLICKMAEIWPHMLLYRAILSSPHSENEIIKLKLQCSSYVQNSPSLVCVLQKIINGNHKLVNDTSCILNEFQRISLLWDELWLACLTSVHNDFFKLLCKFDCDLNNFSELYYLNHDSKNKLVRAKYNLIMCPILKLIYLLMETIALPPETPYESAFQNNSNSLILTSIKEIRNPHELYNQGQIRDAFRRLLDFFFTQQQKQFTQKLMNLRYLSPTLSIMVSEEALLPAISTIDEKPIFLLNVSQDIFIQPTKTRPKKVGMNASDGKLHYFLFKGLENLHLDERIMQILGIVNCLFNDSNLHQQGLLKTRHYKVTPLGVFSGMIEWVENATPIFALYKRWQLNSLPKDELHMTQNTPSLNLLKPSELFYSKLNPLLGNRGISMKTNASLTRKIWPKNVLRDVFLELQNETPSNLISCELWFSSTCSSEWWIIQQCYCRSLAVMSITGYIIGLGDRHLDNILLDFATGEIIHVDYNVCFENGSKLRVPEMVPFRLTQNLRHALGPVDIEGNFRISCERILEIFIKEQETILYLLKSFVNDPLVNWANTKLVYQHFILERFPEFKNPPNIIYDGNFLSVEIMEHWPQWTNLYTHVIEICKSLRKAIYDYQTDLLQTNATNKSLAQSERLLSVLTGLDNFTFNYYLVSLLELNNHKEKIKNLVTALSFQINTLKIDQDSNFGKSYLTKMDIIGILKRLCHLSYSEYFNKFDNIPLELFLSTVPNELKIKYATLHNQLFNILECSTNEIENVLYLLDEHCQFAKLNICDMCSYWVGIIEVVTYHPTEQNLNFALNEVIRFFIDNISIIDGVARGLSQLRLHLENLEGKIKLLEERALEFGVTNSFDDFGDTFERISHYVRDDDTHSKAVLNLIAASLPDKFEKWYKMELIAKKSGNKLCELLSEEGDWFLEEFCTMSGNVYQMLKCGNLVLSQNKLPKYNSLKRLFKSLKYVDRLFCGLRYLYNIFQKEFLSLIIQIQQSNKFKLFKFYFDEISGEVDLLLLIADTEKIFQDTSSIKYDSDKLKLHSIAENIIARYKQYLQSLHFDRENPIFQLLFLIFDNYSKISKIYEDYQILNWKEHALPLTFAMDIFRRSQLLETFVQSDKRQLISDLFLFKYLLLNYNIINNAMNMLLVLTGPTSNHCLEISSESDLLQPLRQYLADFVVIRVLGSPTQILLSVILRILDCIGVLPTFQMGDNIVNISKHGVRKYCQIHFPPANLNDISYLLRSFDVAWRRMDMCKRLNSNLEIAKHCLNRARDFLDAYSLNFVVFLEECPFKSKVCDWVVRFSKSRLTKLKNILNIVLDQLHLIDSEFFLQISLISSLSPLLRIFSNFITKRNAVISEISSVMDQVQNYSLGIMRFYKFRFISDYWVGFGHLLFNSLQELKTTVEITKQIEEHFPYPSQCLLYLDLNLSQNYTNADAIFSIKTEKSKLEYIDFNLGNNINRSYTIINASLDALINLKNDFAELYFSIIEILQKLSFPFNPNQAWPQILNYFHYIIKIWENISLKHFDSNELKILLGNIDELQMILIWTVGYLLDFSAKDLGMDISNMLDCQLAHLPNFQNLNILQVRLLEKLRISLLPNSYNENSGGNIYFHCENTVETDVWKRVYDKFSVIAENKAANIVDSLINDAINIDNLSQMYEGWTSWV